jgi:hypothetical protein
MPSVKLPRMIEELQRSVSAIHDLERAIHLWELLRDNAQRVVDETTACSEKQGDSVKSNLRVAKFQAFIATYTKWILEAKARIDQLAKGD